MPLIIFECRLAEQTGEKLLVVDFNYYIPERNVLFDYRNIPGIIAASLNQLLLKYDLILDMKYKILFQPVDPCLILLEGEFIPFIVV